MKSFLKFISAFSLVAIASFAILSQANAKEHHKNHHDKKAATEQSQDHHDAKKTDGVAAHETKKN